MRSDAVFAHAVHFFGTNLHFEWTGSGTDDRGMQALIHIELRHGDIVLEATRHGVPQRMHGAQNRIAVAHRFHDNAHRDEVVNLGKALATLRHLLIDGIQVLRAAGDMRVSDAHARQLGIERFDNGSQIRLTLVAALGDQAADLLELRRLKVIKREVFKLPLDGADTQPMRDRRINFKRLARLEDASILLQRAQGAHIVQAVGELDNNHANVFAHGNEHLAHSRRLLIGEALDFDARDFRDSLHKLRHLRTELLFKGHSRGVSVFDRVMKKGSAQRVDIHAQIGQNERDLDRMDDIRLAALTFHALVRRACVFVGALELFSRSVVEIARFLHEQRKTRLGRYRSTRLGRRRDAPFECVGGKRANGLGQFRFYGKRRLTLGGFIGHSYSLPRYFHRA